MKVGGCSISLEDVQSDHRVVISVNECDQQAKGVVEKFAPVGIKPTGTQVGIIPFDGTAPFKAFLTDANMGNNLMDCAPNGLCSEKMTAERIAEPIL